MKKRVTVKQIADEIGMSMMTVSRALNENGNINKKTREKVLKTAKKLGYIPNFVAKSLVQQKTFTIGVIIPEITHSFFPEVIRGIEEVAYQSKYQIILAHSAEDQQKEKLAIRTLASKRVDGLLISTAQSVTEFDHYQEVVSHGLPLVSFDRCVYDIGVSTVSIDDELSAEQITEHLIKIGYKKIAHLAGPVTVSIGKKRLNGFKKALKKNKLVLNEDFIIPSGFQEADGYNSMKKLLKLPKTKRPRGIVAVNDPAAFGAMKAILEEGYKIPEDFALVGFSDDIRAELMEVPLTTIRQPAYELGRIATQKLIAHIENSKEKVEEIILPTEIVVRSSCGFKSSS